MPLYTVGVRTPAAGAGAAYCDLRTAASDRARIREIGAVTSAATLSPIGLIRSATVGTASTTTVPQAQEPGDAAATAVVGTAWSTAPTIGAIYLRRWTLPASIGAGIIWTWLLGYELVVPISASVLLWNFGGAAGSALDVYIVYDE